ncbi:MAG: hypothetical protein WCI73_02620 [Phycisphaerae bacterium]
MAAPVHPYSDYGVALRTLKSARGWLSILLVICVITQFIGFGLMYGTQQPYEGLKARLTKTNADELREKPGMREVMTFLNKAFGVDSDQSWFPQTAQSRKLNIRSQWDATYTMVVPVTQVLGLVAASSQAIIVFLTLLLILMAHAPGVAQVTRSLIWTVLLTFLVFPWQFVFTQGFPIPGILWGYHEMLSFIGPHVAAGEQVVHGYEKFLVVARFILWPLLAMFILLITSERFRAGVMLAIGHPLQSMMQAPRGPVPPVPGMVGRSEAAPKAR